MVFLLFVLMLLLFLIDSIWIVNIDLRFLPLVYILELVKCICLTFLLLDDIAEF